MSRRRRAEKREINPDAKFGDLVLAKFMNSLMYDGKKSAAEGIVYGAFDVIQAKTKQDPLQRLPRGAAQRRAGARSALAPRRRRHLSGAGRSAHRPQPRAGDPLADHGRAQPQRTDHDGHGFRASCWTPRTIAATPSRSAKTRTRWRKPTAPSRITAGNA